MAKSIFPTSTKSWFYSIVHPWVSNGLELFFDGFHVKGMEHFPKNGPIMLVANHQNAMIDPLICCRVVPQQLHWLTRSDVFKNPTIAKLLYRLNMLPIYREKDKVADQSERNEAVFSVCRTRLSKGAVISMFPEGSHRGKKQLMVPLKKGFARLAFSSIERDPSLMEMKIVPMALDYSDFYLKHPRLILEIGAPIAIKDYWQEYKEDNNRAINGLIKSVHVSLSSMMVDIKDENDYEMLEKMGPALEAIGEGDVFQKFSNYRLFCNDYEHVSEKEKSAIRSYFQSSQDCGLKVKDIEDYFQLKPKKWAMWLLELLPGIIGKGIYFPLSWMTERFIQKNVQDLLFYNSIRLAFFTFLSPFYTLLIWALMIFIFPINGKLDQLMVLAILVSMGLFSITWSRFHLQISAFWRVRKYKNEHPEKWEQLCTKRQHWRSEHGK